MITAQELAHGAETVDPEEFFQLVRGVTKGLREGQGQTGNLKIMGGLVTFPPIGEAIIVGDLHGDIQSLIHILRNSGFLEKVQAGVNASMIFLGDYGDRGIHSPEVYHVVLRLKKAFPENVLLMRGNHEGPADLLAHPHDLPIYLHRKFGEEASGIYACLRELFDYLHTAVLVEGRFILLHGGAPSQADSLEDLAYAHEKHPQESHLEEILWSDPQEGMVGTYFSPRGAGRLFGEDVTERLLRICDAKILIRGHEPSPEGFKVNHHGKVLTLFSRKGPPYYNDQGAYLHLDFSEKIDDAKQLMQFVQKF